ncbi:MAG: hypothetical protein R2867_19675 [Caldilineaceae bacterium]
MADALTADNFAADNSAYVELHSGLAPTFADQYRLPAGGSVNWRELWYPVQGIDSVTVANELAALHLRQAGDKVQVGIYSTRPLRWQTRDCTGCGGRPCRRCGGGNDGVSKPTRCPARTTLTLDTSVAEPLVVRLLDNADHLLLTHELSTRPRVAEKRER